MGEKQREEEFNIRRHVLSRDRMENYTKQRFPHLVVPEHTWVESLVRIIIFWTNVSPSLPACFLLLSFLSMGCGIWGFYRSQKRALYPLELELHAIVRHQRWMLKFKLWSSTKAKSALKSWTIILFLRLIFKLNKLKYHVLVFWYNIFGEPNTNVAENVI